MTPDMIAQTIWNTEELKRLQAAEDSLEVKATIPRLELSDITRVYKEIPIDVSRDFRGTGATVITHPLSTSGIVYTDVCFDLSLTEFDDLELVPLFTRLTMDTGTSTTDRVAMSRRIGAKTGGLHASPLIVQRAADRAANCVLDPDAIVPSFVFSGKATQDRVADLLEIVGDLVLDANLRDQVRAVEVLREQVAGVKSQIASSGHRFASSRLAAQTSLSGYIAEQLGGVTGYAAAQKLLAQAEDPDAWEVLAARLIRFREALLSRRDGMVVNVTADPAALDEVESSVAGFIERLPGRAAAIGTPRALPINQGWGAGARLDAPPHGEGFAIPTQVNYVGLSVPLVEVGELVPPGVAVATKLLQTGYLWEKIRVVGGAYGAMCSFTRSSGAFSFLSYRDPNLAETFDNYRAAGLALAEQARGMSDADLEMAVIGTIGDMDAPMTTDQRGFASLRQWLSGEEPELRQHLRDQVIRTTRADIISFGELMDARVARAEARVVIGSQAALDAAANEEAPLEMSTLL